MRTTKINTSYATQLKNSVSDFPVQRLEWSDEGETLGLQFENFLTVNIHNGESNNNTIGVMLGAAPRSMKCDANFGALRE
jgi:hypothetical protein